MVQPRNLHGATIEKAGPLCRVEDLQATAPASSVIHTHVILKPMTLRSPLSLSLRCSLSSPAVPMRNGTGSTLQPIAPHPELERFGSLLRKVAFPLLLNVRDIVMGADKVAGLDGLAQCWPLVRFHYLVRPDACVVVVSGDEYTQSTSNTLLRTRPCTGTVNK